LTVEVGGEPFLVPEGPFRLASLCSAPVIPVFARRLGYFRYEVVIRPPIEVARAADAAAIRAAAEQATSEMTTFLRQNPTQWFHFSG
jgi:KDO2-lipid IV(A) lauroyltransferase